MKINIGKNTLGDSDKMSLSLREYGRSTHDLSFAWRGTMSIGTLVPTLKILALPGDTFEFDIESKILTVPTVGPLFGSFKFQTDIFTCPIRLYNAQLHNNALKIGLDMASVKLPVLWGEDIEKVNYSEAFQFNPTGLIYNMGLKGIAAQSTEELTYSILPYMMYYDIFKNYYANKQENNYYQFNGLVWAESEKAKEAITILRITNTEVSLQIKKEYVKQLDKLRVWVRGNSTSIPKQIYLKSFDDNRYFVRRAINTPDGQLAAFIITTNTAGVDAHKKNTLLYTTESEFGQFYGETWNLYGKVEISTEDVPTAYKLDEIDELREYILSKGKQQIVLHTTQNIKELWPLKRIFLSNSYTHDNGGLIVKTHMSDIFNNWIKTETISGSNGISELTKVNTSQGYFTIDTLNLAKKVYEMLNRIAISGGTYKDWIETVYTTDYYFRAETPVYEGGMSCEIVFDEVVSQSANVETDEPLGTLAGRGMNINQKGGKIVIKVNEPCYIIGISSITPRIDYSQGNDFDMMEIKTMNDLHKPQLDGIGFQDLAAEKMCWGVYRQNIGKQPAWLDYMTNFNKTSGKFAVGESQSFMVLNKVYNNGYVKQFQDPQAGFTSYIRPSDFNYIFAETKDTAHNFWVQIGYGIESRRIMSAKEMPNP